MPRHAPRPRPRRLLRAAATAAALAPLGGCLFGIGRRTPTATLEVRNEADVAANLYVLPRATFGEVFLGQVGPRASRTVRIRDASAGDTLSLQARPVDGRAVSTRERLVLGPGAVWRFP
ncbi:hypothetical protein [Roseisolibacter sp. H3M3-2]|uniref:hypothetical protein n=1 Tax=Roseisolibacter sp. H3M3-2 TaxID=3031323 RepID=UPI0023DBDDD0|nr:hypothetical protein [Roseisolibacter sp. H3M3-2]MDF1501398.1 hypothetical protein [Roseisolibacter sp. H3M3-2]